MRGKDTMQGLFLQALGITPTYAGKRKRNPNGMLQSKDHPRLCGEKLYYRLSSTSCAGSPPPMRGKDFWSIINNLKSRITPAYAGKRDSGSSEH